MVIQHAWDISLMVIAISCLSHYSLNRHKNAIFKKKKDIEGKNKMKLYNIHYRQGSDGSKKFVAPYKSVHNIIFDDDFHIANAAHASSFPFLSAQQLVNCCLAFWPRQTQSMWTEIKSHHLKAILQMMWMDSSSEWQKQSTKRNETNKRLENRTLETFCLCDNVRLCEWLCVCVSCDSDMMSHIVLELHWLCIRWWFSHSFRVWNRLFDYRWLWG